MSLYTTLATVVTWLVTTAGLYEAMVQTDTNPTGPNDSGEAHRNHILAVVLGGVVTSSGFLASVSLHTNSEMLVGN